jgi:hypothetical protein
MLERSIRGDDRTGDDEDPDDELGVALLDDCRTFGSGDTATTAGRCLARFGIGLMGRAPPRELIWAVEREDPELSFESESNSEELVSAAYPLVRFDVVAVRELCSPAQLQQKKT